MFVTMNVTSCARLTMTSRGDSFITSLRGAAAMPARTALVLPLNLAAGGGRLRICPHGTRRNSQDRIVHAPIRQVGHRSRSGTSNALCGGDTIEVGVEEDTMAVHHGLLAVTTLLAMVLLDPWGTAAGPVRAH
jgi:hypothetical protein